MHYILIYFYGFFVFMFYWNKEYEMQLDLNIPKKFENVKFKHIYWMIINCAQQYLKQMIVNNNV